MSLGKFSFMTKPASPDQSPKGGVARVATVVATVVAAACVVGIFLVYLGMLLVFLDDARDVLNGDSILPAMKPHLGGPYEMGLRFGEDLYWSREVRMNLEEGALMAVYWSYPLWVALSACGAFRFLRRGKAVPAIAMAILPLFPWLCGTLAIGSWGGRVLEETRGWVKECRLRHPGERSVLVKRGESGGVVEMEEVDFDGGAPQNGIYPKSK